MSMGGDREDAPPAQHGLERDGVLALSGKAAEFPDEDFLEGALGLPGGVQHLLELGPVCDAPTLGLVHVLADRRALFSVAWLNLLSPL